LAAVSNPAWSDDRLRVLKLVNGDLKQDAEILQAVGLAFLSAEKRVYERLEKATLSVKFTLAEKSTNYANMFLQTLQNDSFLSKFETHNPNARSKQSCNAEYTDLMNLCRGTLDTCHFPNSKNLKADKPKSESCCWRFDFRFHLQESVDTNGFLIMVEECGGLGNGQKIELEMAEEVGVKVFRTYTNIGGWADEFMKPVSDAVQDWYNSGCANCDLENVWVGDEQLNNKFVWRPKISEVVSDSLTENHSKCAPNVDIGIAEAAVAASGGLGRAHLAVDSPWASDQWR